MTIFDPRVTHLGYIEMGVTDIARSVDYYAETLGLVESATEDGARFLSIGAEHSNIILRKSDEKTFLGQGYQLKPGTVLDEFAEAVRDFGLPATIKTDSQPGISKLVEVVAPGGNVFHFYDASGSPGPGFGNRGIRPLRLGHVAVITTEPEKLRAFYEDFLGFHYTDDIGGVATFMTCNRDHHVVNVVGSNESRIHHVAFELSDNAKHSESSDILASAGVTTLWGASRHYAGHNLAGYHYDPDKVMIELYTQMDVYLPALGCFEPRPWHESNPQVPMSWGIDKMTNWETGFTFDLVTA